MASTTKFFIISFIIFLELSTLTNCDFELKLRFGIFWPVRTIKCDVVSGCDFTFIICIDEPRYGGRLNPCKYRRLTTKVFAVDVINLGNELGDIKIVDQWRGPISVKVEVWDHDQTNSNDYVDYLSTTYYGPPGTTKYIEMMTRNTRLPISFSSTCLPNYYDTDCSKYCKATSYSKYTCFANGSKLCFPGWTGVNCNQQLTTTTTTTTTTPTTTTTATTTTTPATTTLTISITNASRTTTLPSTDITNSLMTTTLPTTNITSINTTLQPAAAILNVSQPSQAVNESSQKKDPEKFINGTSDDLLPNVTEISEIPPMDYGNNSDNSKTDSAFESLYNITILNTSLDILPVETPKWICDGLNIAFLSNATNNTDIISILSGILLENGYTSFDISINSSAECNIKPDHFYRVEYCTESKASANENHLKMIIEQKFLQHNDNFQALILNCATASEMTDSASFNTILIAVVASIVAAVSAVLIALMVIVNHKRKRRSDELAKLEFTYTYSKDPSDTTKKTIDEDLLLILED